MNESKEPLKLDVLIPRPGLKFRIVKMYDDMPASHVYGGVINISIEDANAQGFEGIASSGAQDCVCLYIVEPEKRMSGIHFLGGINSEKIMSVKRYMLAGFNQESDKVAHIVFGNSYHLKSLDLTEAVLNEFKETITKGYGLAQDNIYVSIAEASAVTFDGKLGIVPLFDARNESYTFSQEDHNQMMKIYSDNVEFENWRMSLHNHLEKCKNEVSSLNETSRRIIDSFNELIQSYDKKRRVHIYVSNEHEVSKLLSLLDSSLQKVKSNLEINERLAKILADAEDALKAMYPGLRSSDYYLEKARDLPRHYDRAKGIIDTFRKHEVELTQDMIEMLKNFCPKRDIQPLKQAYPDMFPPSGHHQNPYTLFSRFSREQSSTNSFAARVEQEEDVGFEEKSRIDSDEKVTSDEETQTELYNPNF